ncbi:MAG TPA: PCRF domain-containing protein, partial [Elusimicrobiota bacterium]|nr:PCRF domain-containing protein [Elusimicrobiota bacterium]
MADPAFRETEESIEVVRRKLEEVGRLLDLPKKRKAIEDGEKEAADPSFWADSVRAKRRSKELNDLRLLVKEFDDAGKAVEDLKVHVELAAEMEDLGELEEARKGLDGARRTVADLDVRLKLSGEFDDNDAIFSLHAGAGGTEACDWADMLLRMYTRWAERKGFTVDILDLSEGEEAGIKGAVLE